MASNLSTDKFINISDALPKSAAGSEFFRMLLCRKMAGSGSEFGNRAGKMHFQKKELII
jgi:hypothetical protein